MSLPWLRLYNETLSDRKFKLISVELNLPRPLILGVWVSLLMLAGESPERGRLLSGKGRILSFAFICDEIGLDSAQLTRIIEEFAAYDMLYVDDDDAITITKWGRRQFKSDDVYERVKKFRAKELPDRTNQRNVSRNVSETLDETEQNTDTESQQQQQKKAENSEIFSAVCKTYEQEIGGLSPSIADKISDAVDTYNPDWIPRAISRAAEMNKRRWAYVEGILKNWKEIGGPQNDGPRDEDDAAEFTGSRGMSRKEIQETRGESLQGATLGSDGVWR